MLRHVFYIYNIHKIAQPKTPLALFLSHAHPLKPRKFALIYFPGTSPASIGQQQQKTNFWRLWSRVIESKVCVARFVRENGEPLCLCAGNKEV